MIDAPCASAGSTQRVIIRWEENSLESFSSAERVQLTEACRYTACVNREHEDSGIKDGKRG